MIGCPVFPMIFVSKGYLWLILILRCYELILFGGHSNYAIPTGFLCSLVLFYNNANPLGLRIATKPEGLILL